MKAAPIFRNTDQRLNGSTLQQPFKAACRRIHATIMNPFHPNNIKVCEFFRRVIGALFTSVGLVLSSPFALVGRIIQVLHFRTLSDEAKLNPQAVKVMGIALPEFENIAVTFNKEGNFYHWTHHAKGVLRSGFKVGSGGNGAMKGAGVYVANTSEDSDDNKYGCSCLELKLDLDERELFCIYTENELQKLQPWNDSLQISQAWGEWIKKMHTEYSNYWTSKNNAWEAKHQKGFSSAIKELFLANGYKAQVYPWKDGRPAVCIYDSSCIKIEKVVKVREKGVCVLNRSLCVDK